MRLNNEAILKESQRYLDLISSSELDENQRKALDKEAESNSANHLNRGLLKFWKMAGDHLATEWTGQGSTCEDIMGRQYIDCLGAYGVYSMGMSHPKIVGAVQAQLTRLPFKTTRLLNLFASALAKLLSDITPGDLQYSFFINSGTEAVEGAMKLARLYTKKVGFVSALNGFHGKSLGSLSVMGKSVFREPFLPLLQGVHFVPFGDAGALDEELKRAEMVGEGIAAVIMEPVQGEAGVIIPTDDYWPRVREICDRQKVLLVVDEIQTGLGRTGKLFCLDHWGVKPDIMTLGKALGGGVVPISAFISTPQIWEVLESPNPAIHSNTSSGNSIAAVAGIAAINVLLEEDLAAQAAEKGVYMLQELQTLAEKYADLITDVRGKGLLIGVEFSSAKVGLKIVRGLFNRGVLVAAALVNPKVIRIEPALNIAKEHLDSVLEKLEDILKETAEELSLNKAK